MRGKTIQQDVVDEAFAHNGRLSQESCGWHYVEGLRRDDDSELALVRDKVSGLNHNGRLSPGLEHEAIMVGGSVALIMTSKWMSFVEDQKRRLAATAAARPTNSPPIRWSDEATLGPNKLQPK